MYVPSLTPGKLLQSYVYFCPLLIRLYDRFSELDLRIKQCILNLICNVGRLDDLSSRKGLHVQGCRFPALQTIVHAYYFMNSVANDTIELRVVGIN